MGESEEVEKDEERESLYDSPDSGVRARVRHIAGLMTRLEWRSYMAAELAEQWGVARSTVRNYSTEASRVVAASVPSGPEAKAGIVEATLRIAAQAEADGNLKDALGAFRLIADLGGHLAPAKTKTELSGPDGGPIRTAGVVVLPALDPEGE